MTGIGSNLTAPHGAGKSGIDVEAWRTAIRDDTFAGYHFEMARAIRREGNTPAALDALARALSIRPGMPEALHERIDLLLEMGRQGEADAELQQATARNPDFLAEACSRLGQRVLEQGQPEEALALLDRSLALRPDDPGTRMQRGLTLLALRRHEDALADLRTAVAADAALEADLVRPYVRLSNWLLCESRQEDALPLLRAAAGLAPYDLSVREMLGHVLTDLGLLDEADAVFRAILREEPGNVRALTIFGQTLCFRDALDEAAVCYERALERQANFPPCLYGLSLVRQAQGRFEDAMALARQAASAPGGARAHSYRGQSLQALGRMDEALEAHRQALALAPQDPLARSLYGFLLPAIGRAAEALDLFRDLAADPAIAKAHVAWPRTGIGLALEALGRHDEAMAEYRAAITRAAHTIVFDMRQRPWTVPILAPAYREIGFSTPWSA